jgi:hypothetical protein
VTYTGWGQRPSDFSRPSWGGPTPGPRSLARRLLTWGTALVVLIGAGLVVLFASDDDEEAISAEEIEERSQPPMVHEARLVSDDRLELEVSGPDGANYCLESPEVAARIAGRLCTSMATDDHAFAVEDLELGPDELVGRELVVIAQSRIADNGGGATLPAELLSEPSEPVEIVDAR